MPSNNNNQPFAYKLYTNYPNPFNPITNIKYEIGHRGIVKINIYDVLGRFVKQIVNEYKEAGNYTIQFDGTNIASGLYIYQIESGNFKEAKKMLLIK